MESGVCGGEEEIEVVRPSLVMDKAGHTGNCVRGRAFCA
jgi:hypothetical protein